jgi:methionine-rich copper-binding protein CopC
MPVRLRTFLCALLAASPAWAHAVLLESTPQARALVEGPVFPVSLRFNSRVDAKRSRLTLVDQSGIEQPIPLTQSAPDTITSQATGTKRGRNRLRWQVLSSDGHITRGELVLQVK